MVRALLLALIVIGGVALLLARAGGDAPEVRLRATGSSTVAPIVAELARRFEATHPGVRIDVESGGSSRGIADTRSRRAEIGMVSRDLLAEESDLRAHPIARDGISLISHSPAPVAGLTRAQVVAIFTGEIRDWSEVGGAAGSITVVHKADGRSTQRVFLERFGLEAGQVRADIIVGENEHGVRAVAADPSAIGYVSIGVAQIDAERGVPIALLPVDDHAPTIDAVRSGGYPWVRTLHLVTSGEQDEWVEKFIAFATSPAASEVIERLRFVPYGP